MNNRLQIIFMSHIFFPINSSDTTYQFHILGSVSAGFPSASEEELQDAVTLDDYLIGNKEASCLMKMPDESMTPAGIMKDDLMIIQRGKVPVSGDIVVVQVETDWMVRRLYKRGVTNILSADNKQYHSIPPHENVKVEGVVTGVVRKYS